jgi:hypothetical protein
MLVNFIDEGIFSPKTIMAAYRANHQEVGKKPVIKKRRDNKSQEMSDRRETKIKDTFLEF